MAQHDKTDLIELREFSENFKFARKRIGLTQAALGKEANIRQEFISLFEKATQSIGIDTMSALSHGLKIPLHYLLEPGFQNTFNFDSRSTIWEEYSRQLPKCEHGASERIIFGHNFKSAREAIQYTQAKIATKTGIPDTKITLIERGTSGAEFFTALKLARAVGKNLFILFRL